MREQTLAQHRRSPLSQSPGFTSVPITLPALHLHLLHQWGCLSFAVQSFHSCSIVTWGYRPGKKQAKTMPRPVFVVQWQTSFLCAEFVQDYAGLTVCSQFRFLFFSFKSSLRLLQLLSCSTVFSVKLQKSTKIPLIFCRHGGELIIFIMGGNISFNVVKSFYRNV